MRKGLTLAVMTLWSLGIAFGQSRNSVAGSWQAIFRDSISSGSLSLELTTPYKGSVRGSYQTTTGNSGTVTGRQGRHELALALSQEGPCSGSYSVRLRISGGTGYGNYSGRDCHGEHSNGVISMAPANGSLSPPPLPAPEFDWGATYKGLAEGWSDQQAQEYKNRQSLEQSKIDHQESSNKLLKTQSEDAEIRLGYLKQQGKYLDEIGDLDPSDPQYKAKLDSLQRKIKLISEMLSGLPQETRSEPPAAIPTPSTGVKPLHQVQILALLGGGVPTHRVAMLVEQRGVNFDPQDDFLQEVRLGGGDDELIRALVNAKKWNQ